MKITLTQLAKRLPESYVVGPDVTIVGVTHDSRKVEDGFAYAAMTGSHSNGYDFIKPAVNLGANAIICSEPKLISPEVQSKVSLLVVPSVRQTLGLIACEVYDHPSSRLSLVGVTGTNGKTTTSFLLDAALSHAELATGVIGTIEVRSANKRVGSTFTTPEGPDLQYLLNEMANGGADVVSMEVSSHGLDQYRVDGTFFKIGIFTNLSPEHLDYHGTMEQYFYAKSKLFDQNRCGKAIINVDDPWGRRLSNIVSIPVTTFGHAKDADYRIERVDVDLSQTTFTLSHEGKSYQISTKIIGAINAHNAAAAFIAALDLGVSAEDATKGIEECESVDGRFQIVRAGQPGMVVVDYAHTPDSIANLINTVRSLIAPGGKVYAIGGARGGRDRFKRPSLGASLSMADVAILTTDNPGDEDPEAIAMQLFLGTLDSHNCDVRVIIDRAEAIAFAVQNATEDDAVVIVGRGHETTIRIGSTIVHLDDREEVAKAAAKFTTAQSVATTFESLAI